MAFSDKIMEYFDQFQAKWWTCAKIMDLLSKRVVLSHLGVRPAKMLIVFHGVNEC